MDTQTIETLLIAPIPIGNRVRIDYLKRPGFFGASIDTSYPKITDLDSGIVYGTFWHRRNPTTESALEVDHSVEGTVEACQVLTFGGDHAMNSTTLAIRVNSS